MTGTQPENPIVDLIGKDIFEWLAKTFDVRTRLRDLPDTLLDRLSAVNIALRNYTEDQNAVTSIALITFAYRLADKTQDPRYGSNDILLLKVLAKNEILRRREKKVLEHKMWDAPLYDILTGDVGETIRATRFITNPF
jgi:hypothetical protein